MSIPYNPDTPRPANQTVTVSGTGTIPVLTGRGVLNSITINSVTYTPSAPSLSALSSEPTLWVFDNVTTATGQTIPTNSANQTVAQGMVQNFGCTFYNGITLLAQGTVNVTVNYYTY